MSCTTSRIRDFTNISLPRNPARHLRLANPASAPGRNRALPPGRADYALKLTDLSGNLTSEYVYFGDQRIARREASGNIFYYAEDFLGSSREVVQAGQTSPCYDADFYPYGGERVYTNTCPQHYKFMSHERDTESGLDDFGARYFSSQYGRFMSADWSAIPVPVPYANFTSPQTLNLCAIVHDNPETFADLDGHEDQTSNDPGGRENPGNASKKKCQQGGSCPKSATPPPRPKKSKAELLAEFLRQARAESQAWVAEHRNEILKQAGFVVFAIVTDGAGELAEAGDLAQGTSEVVATGTKQAIKDAIGRGLISDAQKAAVKSALERGRADAMYTLLKLSDGSLEVLTRRAGAGGYQVIEKLISAGGDTVSVIQKAYDAAGNLIHLDQKLP